MQFNVRELGLILFKVGAAGFLIGGAGLDGPDFAVSTILTVVSFLVAAVGYRLWEISERGEKNQATKEIDARSEEVAF